MRVPRDFVVVPRRFSRTGLSTNRAFLEIDHWDDWGRFATLYRLWITGEDAVPVDIGWVKIGQMAMSDARKPALPERFTALGEDFFSLGQDLSFYENLNSIGAEVRDWVLEGLRDIAADLGVFEVAIDEDVTQLSLLRSVTRLSVEGQFRRAARGLVGLTPYDFTFDLAALSDAGGTPVLEFKVEPDTQPPTNVHALIGSNGVGKSTILDVMARELGNLDGTLSHFTIESADTPEPVFANLVSISFSAFDTFEVPDPYTEQLRRIRRANVGLRRSDGLTLDASAPDGLAREFANSFVACKRGSRSSLLKEVLRDLTSDPIFANDAYEALSAALDDEGDGDQGEQPLAVFSRLSTGHKVSLLALTRLVELVEDRSLVLFDEPEAHLHPPLLAAFVRALTRLVGDRNGVAILATHSPVVLQELPRACVYIIRRSGSELRADRPENETFGENLGTLTREVFGYEVTETDFHQEIRRAVDRGESLAEIRQRFGDQLGSEALAIARALTANRY